jgi:hypothetical protein
MRGCNGIVFYLTFNTVSQKFNIIVILNGAKRSEESMAAQHRVCTKLQCRGSFSRQKAAVKDSLRVYDPQGRRRLGEDQDDRTTDF